MFITFFYFCFVVCFMRERGRESEEKARVGVLYEKTDYRKWPTILVANLQPLSLCVCVTHSYIDKGIRCSFRNLALTFMKKLYLLTVLACINGCSDGCAGSYFFGSNQPCSAHAVKLTSFSFGYPMYNIVVSDIYYFEMSWLRFFFIHQDYD